MTAIFPLLNRLAAVALLLLLLGGAYALGVRPLLSGYQERETALADARDLLARLRNVAAAESDLRRQVEEVTRRQGEQSYYLMKETDALAAAELQDRVQVIVAESGGTIRSIQTLPGENEGEFQRITLRLQMTTTTEALFRIIYSLETGQPLLFLDNVDIQSRSARMTGERQTTEPTLTVSFDLYGYRPPEEL